MPFHVNQISKNKPHQELVRVWQNRGSHIIVHGCVSDTIILERNLTICSKGDTTLSKTLSIYILYTLSNSGGGWGNLFPRQGQR